jgi:hypothetical protein
VAGLAPEFLEQVWFGQHSLIPQSHGPKFLFGFALRIGQTEMHLLVASALRFVVTTASPYHRSTRESRTAASASRDVPLHNSENEDEFAICMPR